MDTDTTALPTTAAVQPGNAGGPVLVGRQQPSRRDGAHMNDIAALVATRSVPQSVNFGMKTDVLASFLRVNG